IEGDHLIPVVYNRRLYLFWPHFEEKPDSNQDLGVPYIESSEHVRWSQEYPKWKAKDEKHQDWVEGYNYQKKAADSLEQTKEAYRRDEELTIDCSDLEEATELRSVDEGLTVLCDGIKNIRKIIHDFEKQEPEDPGPKPEEPAYSTPPAVIHREIKLAWSEYWNGKWSPKQTSSSSVVSRSVKSTFKEFTESYKHHVDIVATKDTIVDLYLPREEEHFFKTEIEDDSEDLLINVYRRFVHEYKVLGTGPATIKRYEKLGRYRLSCGTKVKAASDVTDKQFKSFSGPDDTTNSFMAFEHEEGPDRLSVNSDGPPLEVFAKIPNTAGEYNLLHEHQFSNFRLPTQSFFYQDKLKTYFAHQQLPESVEALTEEDKTYNDVFYNLDDEVVSGFKAESNDADSSFTGSFSAAALTPQIRFETFFHPHLCEFLKELYRDGITGLLRRSLQQSDNDIKKDKTENVFWTSYKPTAIVDSAVYPRENVDFDGGAYALYNWEIFFHAPLLIATSLSRNQQFEDARAWFHFVFNPTTSSKLDAPQRYWKTLPLFNNSHPENDQIQQLLNALGSTDKTLQPLSERVRQQIDEWRENPFNPHLIARLRITAYQKNVVMRYIDNLIDWADQLFSQDTIESINEATLLYVLAYNILGPRPDVIPPNSKFEPKTFSQLKDQWDEFSNAMVTFENELAASNLTKFDTDLLHSNISRTPKVGYYPKKNNFYSSKPTQAGNSAVKSVSETFYFGIPRNDELVAYWDTVADRLFKIHHCMNIEGVGRELSLFEPPIDPALLVRAQAMGLDLSSVLNDMNSPQPAYRFNHMLQKAMELCGELKSLGGALLAVLEKKDAEALSLLRSDHELALLNAVLEMKKRQIDEGNEVLDGLSRSREVIEARRDYYRDIERLSGGEREHLDKLTSARTKQAIAQTLELVVPHVSLFPDLNLGSSGWAATPIVAFRYGGGNLSEAAKAASRVLSLLATLDNQAATMAADKARYDRAWNEWKQQEKVANKELDQIDKQIAAAKIRVAIAEKDKENQELQIENSQVIQGFLRSKYTNEELYNWMLSQVSSVFFQSYQLAYDMAKRAEKAFQFERGLTSSSYVQFGYWDNLRKGLLAGEKLALDLKRMEAAYLDQNRREYEITKHVSLLMNDPLALIELKETGECEMFLPEALFDADYPGHYMRRLKSVSLTIPCVVGPYTSINCTLTLLSNKTRISNVTGDQYEEKIEQEDQRFISNFAAMQSIATSHAQNDSGMFELNFRDERYLPFEGAGAISRWRIEMPRDTNAFDFNTLSDVVLHLKYTAREGGATLKNGARDALKKMLADENLQLTRLFSFKHEFPTEWYRFLHPIDLATTHTLSLTLTQERFPFMLRGKAITLNAVTLFLKMADDFKYDADTPNLTFHLGQDNQTQTEPIGFLAVGSPIPGLPFAKADITVNVAAKVDTTPNLVVEVLESELPNSLESPETWWQSVDINGVTHRRLKPNAIQDVWMVCRYSAASTNH
ncbi:MAG: neuraminidase-like domain-containing protein, partial [Pyrinomonadaceae bacterium]|nr:neuraminidase-like domain-containing protein [Pyrinomonadaceae bacterium]